jgi:hypothetical protein
VANKFLFCFSRGIQEVFAGKRARGLSNFLNGLEKYMAENRK